jgi:nucleotide-binding universal stress UspA family protein
MFQRILVPLDGSSLAETVLPHVVALAKASECEVTLLRVLDPQGEVTRPISVDPFDWKLRKSEAEAYLRRQAQRLEEAGVMVQVEVVEGKAAEMVIRFAHDHTVDLVLLSSHGQSGISSWNVSSVVQKIILRVRRSVMIVRAYRPTPESMGEITYQRILAPLDGSQRAEVALPDAAALARAHNAELMIAHVVERPEMPRRTPLSDEENELLNRLVESNRVEAERYLDEIKTRLAMRVETRLLVEDKMIAALHNLAENEQVDLVVVAAHGYTGETRWPYGSVATSFITYGSRPLLIVQDLPEDRIELTDAELAAREQGGR